MHEVVILGVLGHRGGSELTNCISLDDSCTFCTLSFWIGNLTVAFHILLEGTFSEPTFPQPRKRLPCTGKNRQTISQPILLPIALPLAVDDLFGTRCCHIRSPLKGRSSHPLCFMQKAPLQWVEPGILPKILKLESCCLNKLVLEYRGLFICATSVQALEAGAQQKPAGENAAFSDPSPDPSSYPYLPCFLLPNTCNSKVVCCLQSPEDWNISQ